MRRERIPPHSASLSLLQWRERLLHCGQRRESVIPACDLSKSGDWVLCNLRQRHPWTDRKIRQSEIVSGKPFAALQTCVEHLTGAAELLLAFRDGSGVGVALPQQLLDQPLEGERSAGLRPVRGFPILPAAHVGLAPRIGRPQTCRRLL